MPVYVVISDCRVKACTQIKPSKGCRRMARLRTAFVTLHCSPRCCRCRTTNVMPRFPPRLPGSCPHLWQGALAANPELVFALLQLEARTHRGLRKDAALGRAVQRSGLSLPYRSFPDCIIRRRGYDFREGQEQRFVRVGSADLLALRSLASGQLITTSTRKVPPPRMSEECMTSRPAWRT
jgi:hypothetical protein